MPTEACARVDAGDRAAVAHCIGKARARCKLEPQAKVHSNATERADKPRFCALNLLNSHGIMYHTAGEAMTKSRKIEFPDALARPPEDPFYARDLSYALQANYGSRNWCH